MTQSSNLGAVVNGSGSSVRTGFNTGFQALVTESEGASTPSPTYAFMTWRDDTGKLVKRRNAANSGWDIIQNYGATTDPVVGSDSTLGYVRGSNWINTTGNKWWICSNPAAGAAVWKEIGAGGGGTNAYGTVHVSGQTDIVAGAAPDAMTIATSSNGILITTTPATDTITYALDYATTATVNKVCQANDARLSDSRTPTAHATTHKSGGSDPIKLDEFAAPTDITTLNATTSLHGLLRKLDGNSAHFLDGTGAWTTPGSFSYLPVNVKDAPYNAVGDNSTDDTTAIAAAAAAAVSASRALYFPAGNYKMTAQLSMANCPATIFGDGIGLSRLTWTSGASTRGISITANADRQFHSIHDLSLCSAGAHVGTALKLDYGGEVTAGTTQRRTRQRFSIDNIEMVGSTADLSDTTTGWLKGVDVISGLDGGVSNCQFTGQVDSTGVGYKGFVGSMGFHFHGAGHPVQFALHNCTVNHSEIAVQFDDTVEGGFVHNCNFVRVGNGVYANANATEPQIQVENCHINSYDNAIIILGKSDCNINNNLIYFESNSTSNSMVYLAGGTVTPFTGSDRFVISHNVIASLSAVSAGININKADTGVIDGNIMTGFVTMGTGILLGASAQNISGVNNRFTGTITTKVSDSGTGNAINNAFCSFQPKSYTIATKPSASVAGQIIYLSDGASSKKLAVSDGSVWRYQDGVSV